MTVFKDEYGQERQDVFFVNSLLKGFNEKIEQSSSHVYGLVGDWGSGKTTFIRFWESYVKEEKKDKYSIIHVDSFSKDYIEDPFMMLLSAFKEFMKENSVSQENARQLIDKAKIVGKAVLKGLVSVIVGRITNQSLNDFLDCFLEEYDYNPDVKEINPCDDLRNEINKVLSGTGKKLYIVIDELDRCRPDFALECLERIKHIFNIDGIKFVLVYNPKVITGIVKNKYGCEEKEARNYINKFVEYEISINLNLKAHLKNYISNECIIMGQSGRDTQEVTGIAAGLASLFLDFNLTSLRDIRLIINSLLERRGGVRFGPEDSMIWHIIVLLKYFDREEYDDIITYLSLNHVFASNAPKRSTYLRIARFFFSEEKEDYYLKMFEKTFDYFRDNF